MTTAPPSTLLLAVLVAASAALSLSCSPPKGERIVLITLDTLRSDSFLGTDEHPSSMPRTLALASQGAIFDRFHAATSATQPSHASMFTGLHPWQHGVTRNGQLLSAEAETVAESLAADGWQTAAVVASFPVASRFGFAQGFDHYDEEFDYRLPIDRWGNQPIPQGHFYSTAETITAKAIARLKTLDGKRQLLWVHYFDPHSPYGDSAGIEPVQMTQIMRPLRRDQPIEEILRRARQGYEADVAAMDRHLSSLLRYLADEESRFNTHIVVAADHGESFGEHGALAHGKRLTPEQIRVPLFILSPRVEAGHTQRIAGSIDIAATLLEFAGLPYRGPAQSLLGPPRRPASAVGMRSTFSGQASELRVDGTRLPILGYRFFAVGRDGRWIVGNGRHLLPAPATSSAAARGERAIGESERALALFAQFERQLEATPSFSATDDETRRVLRALGYVD